MLMSLLILAVVTAAIVLYFVIRTGNRKPEGERKLINRDVPPYETDTTKAGAADYE